MRSTYLEHVCRLSALCALAGIVLAAMPARCSAQFPDLGINASLHGKMIFPIDNPWNMDISAMPVDPNSATLMASMGLTSPLHPDFGTTYQNKPIGFDYIVVPGTQTLKPIAFTILDESD